MQIMPPIEPAKISSRLIFRSTVSRTFVAVVVGIVLGQVAEARNLETTHALPASSVSQCQSSFLLRLQDLRARYQTSIGRNLKSERSLAALELGNHLQQMGRYQEAHPVLQDAVNSALIPLQRSKALIALANVEVELGRRDLAQIAYREAIAASPAAAEISVSVALNQLFLMQTRQPTVPVLQALETGIQSLPDGENKARYLVQYVLQAKRSSEIKQFNWESNLQQKLQLALQMAMVVDAKYLQVEILDQQAQLLEELGRDSELLAVSDSAILLLQQLNAPELMIALEARRARVFARHQQTQNAIKSYKSAVRYCQEIRQDIPVSYAQGRSSLREIIDPVYLGLADALLKSTEQADANETARLLYQVRDVVEQIKQNQLDDYLGNRCTTSNTSNNKPVTSNTLKLSAGTAVLYPIIFSDRLELLLESAGHIERHRVDIRADKLTQEVTAFSSALRANQSYKTLSRRLYQLLLAPLDKELSSRKIETLVIVPDGVLRLLAFAALHDGQQYSIQKYAVVTSPGLRIIAQQDIKQFDTSKPGNKYRVLLAGVSEPGTVVDRLPEELVDQLLQADDLSPSEMRGKAARKRALQSGSSISNSKQSDAVETNSAEDAQAVSNKLKQILRLDGVDAEIKALQKIVPATSLLNQAFSSHRFAQQVQSGQFDIVHIASHGIFGSSAEKTFILAHDDVITIDQLQSLLSVDQLNKRPLDLLILSACETAEGDDRAPLGISGAALKAKARSAMGSLWPVSDLAASQLMQSVYQNFVNQGMSKAQSLRQAQLELMQQPAYLHPNYWAAFILVGDWQ
ncbi:CHAT domain-containing protein [Undibacterium sp. Di24W]|uniref:CHAT domain-containing protein n=1 Tax=Undibacterium sp. Di24W TaxID=3413033 RepID=UPI003BF124C6